MLDAEQAVLQHGPVRLQDALVVHLIHTTQPADVVLQLDGRFAGLGAGQHFFQRGLEFAQVRRQLFQLRLGQFIAHG